MNAHDNPTAPNPKQTTAVSILNPVNWFIVDVYTLSLVPKKNLGIMFLRCNLTCISYKLTCLNFKLEYLN